MLADKYWSRWIKEYLPTLTKRTKWFQPVPPVQLNDLVLIVDGSMPRGCWLKGKITATYPGKDGQVRVIDVMTAYGTYRRPVSKLAVLELNMDEDS